MKRLSGLFKDAFQLKTGALDMMIPICSECAPDPCGTNTSATRKLLQAADGISKECIICDGPNCDKRNPLNKCTRCRAAYYCSRECQLEHWNDSHKLQCAVIKRRSEEYHDRESQAVMLEKISYNKGEMKVKCYECGISPPIQPVHLDKCMHSLCLECIYDWQDEVDETGFVDGWSVYCQCGNKKSSVDVKEQAKTKGDVYVWYAETHPLCQWEKMKFFNYALEEHEKILKFVPKDLDACYSKATVLKLSGRLDEALKLYNDIDLWIRPYGDTGTNCITLQDIAVHRADILRRKGRWREALSIFNHQKQVIIQVLESSEYPVERYQDYLNNMIRCGVYECKINLGMSHDVVKELDNIHAVDRTQPTLHKWMSLALKEIGDFDGAIESIQRGVLYEAPYDPVTKINNFHLYQELCALKQKNIQVKNIATERQFSDTIPLKLCDVIPMDLDEEKIHDSDFLKFALNDDIIRGKGRSPFIECFINSIRSIDDIGAYNILELGDECDATERSPQR